MGFRVLTILFVNVLLITCQEVGVPQPSKSGVLADSLYRPPVKNLS